jgi:hypothetical protein
VVYYETFRRTSDRTAVSLIADFNHYALAASHNHNGDWSMSTILIAQRL